MNMNHVQRLILTNQYEIMAKLDPDRADYFQRCKTIVEHGYCLELLELEKKFGLIEHETCLEVNQALEMYQALRVSYDNLPATEQSDLSLQRIIYLGYSRQEEQQLAEYVDFLLDDEKRFATLDLQNQSLDAQAVMHPKYVRMLAVWRECPRQYKLSLQEIRNILAA